MYKKKEERKTYNNNTCQGGIAYLNRLTMKTRTTFEKPTFE